MLYGQTRRPESCSRITSHSSWVSTHCSSFFLFFFFEPSIKRNATNLSPGHDLDEHGFGGCLMQHSMCIESGKVRERCGLSCQCHINRSYGIRIPFRSFSSPDTISSNLSRGVMIRIPCKSISTLIINIIPKVSLGLLQKSHTCSE